MAKEILIRRRDTHLDSLRLPSFTAEEVAALLDQHTEDTGQVFADDTKAAAYELTRGQPWLVNALARQLIDTVVPDRERTITVDHLRVAKEILIRRRDTHIDSLLDRLREKRVRSVLEPILAGELPEDEVLNDDVQFVKDLGLAAIDPATSVGARSAAFLGASRRRGGVGASALGPCGQRPAGPHSRRSAALAAPSDVSSAP